MADNERLEQRLGGVIPASQRLDVMQLNKQVDKYGLPVICEYPQVLFDGHERLQPPAYRYPDLWLMYSAPSDGPTNYQQPMTMENVPAGQMNFHTQGDPLERLRDAYRLLDDIFASIARYPSPRPSAGYTVHNETARPGYE